MKKRDITQTISRLWNENNLHIRCTCIDIHMNGSEHVIGKCIEVDKMRERCTSLAC